ncbi:hypothetical protein S40293_11172 [Stachybotrys chartarum IBT 40293]|nr:hypothetical protein S40293_11172 [Stachybotrys chartarum IBT 40293]KFA80729.1 hypothetical protein S40288_10646 [Stachybotrys chartarum IBT 40288]
MVARADKAQPMPFGVEGVDTVPPIARDVPASRGPSASTRSRASRSGQPPIRARVDGGDPSLGSTDNPQDGASVEAPSRQGTWRGGGWRLSVYPAAIFPRVRRFPTSQQPGSPSTFPMFRRPKPPLISQAVRNSSRLTFAWLLLGQRPTGLSPGSL